MFTKLNDLKPFKSTWRVRVKVLHSWRQFPGMSGETLDLILADEHGCKMHAGVKKRDIGRLSKDLKVGEWRVVENLEVREATGQFRPTGIDGGLNHCILIDVMGQVLNVKDMKVVPVAGKEKRKLEFVLRDTELPSDGLAITITEEDEEELHLQRKQKDEEWLSMDLNSIYEVKSSSEVEKFRISAKVTAIDSDWGWYYFGCGKCQHRVFKDLKKENSTRPRPQVPIWYCDNYKTNVKSVSPKFKLHLLIEDDSDKTKVMLLDSVAEGLVTKSATFLLNGSTDEIQDPELLPDSIKDLVGSTFEFLVGVEKEHIIYGNDIYKAHKVKKGLLIVHDDSLMSRLLGMTVSVPLKKKARYQSVVKSNGSTPSPKRAGEDVGGVHELSSTSKKPCTKVINLDEKITEKSDGAEEASI
ncbi:unnamed protein product [Microthlaspi erraticum]|uniref:Replication protein A 70 kDa DNA-binding subunit B/D first OB fold domain-containing protein n=1 Tax=Microthlaspi erraticum TaxID=1685480 RepID=A0A6D2J895_9BRAS|nr:unnamed protein product [Microthlaspi erraticum]